MKFIVKSKSNIDFKKIIKVLPSKHRDGYQYIIEATIFYKNGCFLISHNKAGKAQVYSKSYCDIDIIEPIQLQKNECVTDIDTISFKVPSTLLDSICQYIEEYDLLFEITSDLLRLNFITKPLHQITENKDPNQYDMDFDDNEVKIDKQVKQDIPTSIEISIISSSFKKSVKKMVSSFQVSAQVLASHFKNASTLPTNSTKIDHQNDILDTETVALQYCRVSEHESRLIIYTKDCKYKSISSFKCTPRTFQQKSFLILIPKLTIKILASLLKGLETITVSLKSSSTENNNGIEAYYLTLSAGCISFSVKIELKDELQNLTKTFKEIITSYSHNEQPCDVHKWNEFLAGNELYKSNAHAMEASYNDLIKNTENNIIIKFIFQEDFTNQATSTLNSSIYSEMPFQCSYNFKLKLSYFRHAIRTLSEHGALTKISSNKSNYDGILLSGAVGNKFDEKFYFLLPFES